MSNTIIVRKDLELGVWQGIGGSITESTAYNFAKLDARKQQQFLKACYHKSGLDYRWGRLSIGSNDFCLAPFEYTKKKDLSDFSIIHDQTWLIPMLKKVLDKKKIKFVASPWSPPKCLKLTLPYNFGSFLKPWCYWLYAKYIDNWIEAYRKEGINICFITPQNEPLANQIWESCYYTLNAQKKLAYRYLAPKLENQSTQILLWDYNKEHLLKNAKRLFNGRHVTEFGLNNKVAGISYHWYDGIYPNEMWQVRQSFPNILMFSTEMCCGFSPYSKKEWQTDASLYLREIFSDINSGTDAWIDWNMLLDWHGGPNYCANYTKSPIILNEKGDDFILTPIYIALQKLVKLFPAGSRVVRCEYDFHDIVAIARKIKSGYQVVIANLSDKEQAINIRLGDQERSLVLKKREMSNLKII